MMDSALASMSPRSSTGPTLDVLAGRFKREGYLVFESVVDRAKLSDLTGELLGQLQRDRHAGQLFAGGGNLSGHLNCFPGAGSRFVYDALKARGIFDIVRALCPTALREPNIGCNLNLPGSRAQNEHVDGSPLEPFFVVNVAAVDTTVENGAMEILCASHQRIAKYWEILLSRPVRRRVELKQGDAVLRVSTLWHRGMPNHSHTPRPMLAFTWEGGGSERVDPYAVHDGRITFLPNRFKTDWKGRLTEHAVIAAPRLATVYNAARSFLKD
jgi:hypothetical protein